MVRLKVKIEPALVTRIWLKSEDVTLAVWSETVCFHDITFCIRKREVFLAFKLSYDVHVYILLINVKMPTIVGILTFMSSINFMLR